MKKINVGIIGMGFIGSSHIEALRRLGYINVKAISDIDAVSISKKASELFVPDCHTDYKRMLEDENINAVHVCTPNYLHYSMVKDALLAGKHVLCEKPLTISSAEAKELVNIAKEKKLANAVGFNLRFYPMIQQIKSMIRKNDLGDIFAINGSYQQDWLLHQTDYNWRIDPKIGGPSRVVADIGSHWMDTVGYMTGLEIKRVCADFATFYGSRRKEHLSAETYSGKMKKTQDTTEVNISTEDHASVLLHFDNKARGCFTASQVASGRKNRLYFEIYGSKKSVSWSSERPDELWIGNRDDSNHLMLKDLALAYKDVLEYIGYPGGHNEGFPDTLKQSFNQFYKSIIEKTYLNGTNHTYATFETGENIIGLVEKIYISSKQMKWIDV